MDRAGRVYWEQYWKNTCLPKCSEVSDRGLKNYANRRFKEYFLATFRDVATPGKTLLEIGCARSIWLSYFANQFGFKVSGIDYSPTGSEDTKRALIAEGLDPEIVCADFFDPPYWMRERYDVLVSFGVAEHFQDTHACISAFAKMLKPGGIMITFIPNMVGLIGQVQKLVDREVFDIHVQLDVNDLQRAHKEAGMEILDCEYFLSTSFGVCHVGTKDTRLIPWLCRKGIIAALSRLSMAIWFLEQRFHVIKPNWVTSPYIKCLARKAHTNHESPSVM